MTMINESANSFNYQGVRKANKETQDEIPTLNIFDSKPVERPPYHYMGQAFTFADSKMFSKDGLKELNISDVISKGLDIATSDTRFMDTNKDKEIQTSEMAAKMGDSMARLLDLNDDGIINHGEMLAFSVYQDTLDGSLDGSSTDKGKTQFQINRITDFENTKNTMKGIYDSLKVLFEPGRQTMEANGETYDLGPNSAWMDVHFKELPKTIS